MSLSTSTGAQEAVIGDLFGNTSELGSDMDTRIIRFGDVNLDGVNFTVPAVSANCGDAIELETMWGGLNSDTGTTVVEVAATNEEDLHPVNNVVYVGETEDSEMEDNLSKSEGTRRAVKSRTKPTDFIVDIRKRKKHFDFHFRKLTRDFHRIRSRTGCKGTLSAFFEGNSYEGPVNSQDVTTLVELNDSKTSMANSTSTTVSNSNGSIGHIGMDDHRYAATMLTQNVSSSAARDHQYVEKTTASAPEPDTSDYDDDDDNVLSSGGKFKDGKKTPMRNRYEYISVRWERTQTFSRLIKTLFNNKIVVEKRTGAVINLNVAYENINISDENYKTALNVITNRRKQLLSKTLKLFPAPQQNCTSAPVTFIIPSLTTLPFQVPCILPTQSQLGSSMGDCRNLSISVPVSHVTSNASHSVTDTTFHVSETPYQTDNDTVYNLNESNNEPTLTLVENDKAGTCISLSLDTAETGLMVEENNLTTVNSNAPSPFIPVIEAVQDIGEQLMAFDNSSMQNSPEITVARGMKESASNTEPICSICFNNSGTSNNSYQGSGDRCTTKSFWIRCNDPFCYEMVHASCVGFAVTHNVHLRQLPAFYCKMHR